MYKKEFEKKGICDRCGIELSGKQKRWCSKNCGKLGLKRLYKKRNLEKIAEYKREYRKKGIRPMNCKRSRLFLSDKKCERCHSKENLNVHHIKPLRFSGNHDIKNLMPLCFKCHMEWENRMKGFWIK